MAMKMLQGLDLVSYMERLRAATVSLLENRKTQRDLIYVYKYLVGGVQKMEPDSSQQCHAKEQEE